MAINNHADILLVEDDASDAELAMRAFRKTGLDQRVEHVSDGAEALEYLEAIRLRADKYSGRAPKLILLDLQLPKIGGLQVLRRLKADDRTKAIPIVAFTSSKLAIEMAQGYGLGVNSYVIKPNDGEEFARIITAVSHYWLNINEMPEM
jgi:two-component system, response regulator